MGCDFVGLGLPRYLKPGLLVNFEVQEMKRSIYVCVWGYVCAPNAGINRGVRLLEPEAK